MIPEKNKVYTYKDYLTFPDDERIEIIGGELYNMSSPSVIHQSLITNLIFEIQSYIKSNKGDCKVFTAPFDVVLKNDDEDVEKSSNVVIPDISVICDKNKLNDKGCDGAPDWIVEIVSPSSQRMDYMIKLFKYRTAGVREYWIVDKQKNRITVYNFENDEMKEYTFSDSIKVGIYQGFEIDFSSM